MPTHPLSETITSVYDYYWQHREQLPIYEQFHFVSRLFLLKHDARAQAALANWKQENNNQEALLAFLEKALTNTAPITHSELRQPFLDKYPTIRPIARRLFTYHFAKTLFNEKIETLLPTDEEKAEWTNLINSLLLDTTALKELSAFATNFILMVTNTIKSDSKTPLLFEFCQSLYNPNQSPKELELWIYFLTHLIIGDTLFYTSTLPKENQQLYTHMMELIEEKISTNFHFVHLDCKVEYLVCCELSGYESSLVSEIGKELTNSLADDGHYVIDKINHYPQKTRATFDTSEHRNVLAIIAFYDELAIS
jgi:hypothetical protein